MSNLTCLPQHLQEWTYDNEGGIVSAPVFIQLDAGPDRYTDCNLGWRAKMWEMGIVLFPGLPNGTAGNQVLDDLFGPYKTGCTEVMEDLVAERLTQSHLDPTVKVALDFCDLGRVINGRPEDPVEKRPFCKSFTSAKILASTRRLGLSPIDLRTALAHPRVRDDSADGSRNDAHEQLRETSRETLSQLAAIGVNSQVLEVHAPAQPPQAFVAPPSEYEARWKAVKAAGGSAGAHWAAVGPKAFNAPDVVLPALERLEEKAADKSQREQLKANNFAALRDAVQEIIDDMVEEQEEYCERTVADLKLLVSYHFQARAATGASAHTTNKATLLQFLEGVPMDDWQELIENPSASVAVPIVQAELVDDSVPAVLELTDNSASGGAFGDIDVQLPEGLVILTKPPDFLTKCLEQDSETAADLIGRSILYRWPTRLGGWLVAEIKAVNTDKRQKVGDTVANFVAFYQADGGQAYHSFKLEKYAKTAKAHTDAWLLLGPA